MGFWNWLLGRTETTEDAETREKVARLPEGGDGRAARKDDDDEKFDGTGFVIGAATGIPIGPRGVTPGSIIGSMMHSSPTYAADTSSYSAPSPSHDSGSSSSYDSGSSSSYDSGSSFSGGSDGGSSF